MRPLRLDVAGFTVFREHATLDLTGADLFALVGPTGSGKSTLLDAICFALYGTVPRWPRKSVSGALAPSSAEARVRLVFEAAGQRYVASRVVRRVGKQVQTKHAGLERLHPGFDLSTLDTGLTDEQLGEVLAGTPAEMDRAVEQAVGLPFEQFITCVLLPQGAFAEFLHATPATRQQILVNLLGLGVYDEIRERANSRAQEADAKLHAIDSVLSGDVPGDDQIAQATARLAQLSMLAAEVDTALPALSTAEQAATTAAQDLRRAEEELRAVGGIQTPPNLTHLDVRATEAIEALRRADREVSGGEAAEEELLRARDTAGDPAVLAKLLDAYDRADEIPGEIDRHAAALAVAEQAHGARVSTVEEAALAVRQAEAARDKARDAELAAALRGHLVTGEDCPVCAQPVHSLPQVQNSERLTEADRRLSAARAAHGEAERVLRESDRELTTHRANLAGARERMAKAEAWFAGKLDRASAAEALAAAQDLAKRLEASGVELRKLRSYRQAAQNEADGARAAVQRAWGDYDRARDSVARYEPPAPDRENLPGSWQSLTAWAADRTTGLTAIREAALAASGSAAETLTAARSTVEDLFRAAAVPTSGQYVRDAAVAVERASAAVDRLTEAAERARQLREQRAGHEAEARTARALAQHLTATNFKRWLLEEALDQLVDGASALLLELSGGQYELGHDKGEFFVVDQFDAGLRRTVRTLSGGETFQASLALALALSERLSGMSETSAALGSIILDEGFGTLDAATLDTVAATLENLAARGDRLVGVVTHVPSLAERIPVRFEVSKSAVSATVKRVG